MTFLALAPGGPVQYEVIGLVEDAAYRSLRAEMSPTMYISLQQWDDATSTAAISVVGAGERLALSRAVAQSMNRELPAVRLSFRSLSDQIDASLVTERLVAKLAGFFGLLATGLAALGIYGVTAYAVGRRRREIGIRMALGADTGRVVRMVLRRLYLLVALGLLIGAALSMWASKYVASLLYGLQPRDTATLLIAGGLLATASLIAGWMPARRAARIDPAIVLREF
jgi:ABC-type antimicrobial peptide transport system permease subunit